MASTVGIFFSFLKKDINNLLQLQIRSKNLPSTLLDTFGNKILFTFRDHFLSQSETNLNNISSFGPAFWNLI